jgi:hypothetical protein
MYILAQRVKDKEQEHSKTMPEGPKKTGAVKIKQAF